MSITIHETIHDFGDSETCINGNCQTYLEHFVEASAQDGVIFTSETDTQSQVTRGTDFLLYNQYATSDTEGFAISGAAYVMAPDDLRRNQPEVYEFYRDNLFEGREYIEIFNDDCRSSRIEVRTTETIQLQQQVQRRCSAEGN
ncbi:hypothetical protein KBD71_04485 [Candidatus Woesebacteria bacterium]|nr:hypothetical protein [Candidatus Woesebacteria bacterium]